MKFKKLTFMQWKRAIFWALFISMILLQVVNERNNLISNMSDEGYYADVTGRILQTGTIQGLFNTLKGDFETKTAPFIALQLVLRAYDSIIYTRAFNIALIILITIIVYDMSKRKEAILIPVIFWMMNSMWLTNEVVELAFIIVALRFAQYSGVLVGIATLFRPWALLYTPLLKRSQVKYVLCIGLMYVGILLYYDSFFFYLSKVYDYAIGSHAFTAGNEAPDYVAILCLSLMFILGHKTKLFWFGVVAMIPLSTKLYAHYFVGSMTLFYFGYLIQLNQIEKNKMFESSQLNDRK